jgi:hypothetical protein
MSKQQINSEADLTGNSGENRLIFVCFSMQGDGHLDQDMILDTADSLWQG